MKFRYQQQLFDLSCAVFILKELCFRIEMQFLSPSDHHKEQVFQSLRVWRDHYELIKDIKVRWWDFGDKRDLVRQLNIYKENAKIHLSDETAKEYNLL